MEIDINKFHGLDLLHNCRVCSSFTTMVDCPFCDYIVCVSCTKKYLCETVLTPHCMSCLSSWSHQFLEQTFSKHFLQHTYRKKQETLLWEKEKSYLPSTKSLVMYTIQMEDIDEKIDTLTKELVRLKEEINVLKKSKRNIQQQLYQSTTTKSVSCPVASCCGILDDKSGRCQLCHRVVCTTCNEVKNESHVCNPDTLQTIQFIKETSKQCPNCNVLIHRTSGCDHMWCTSCHTPFHWNTLEMERKILPNPHYYEYMAKQATNILESSVCDETVLLDKRHYPLVEQRILSASIDNEIKRQVLERVQHCITIREKYFSTIITENEYTNQDIRIDFLRNKLSEEECKSIVYTRHKKHRIEEEYKELLHTYLLLLSNWYIHDTIDTQLIEKEMALRTYINQHITTLNNYHHTYYKTM